MNPVQRELQAEALWQEYEAASRDIYRAGDASGSCAEPIRARRGREARYAQTYQRLVRAGLAPQLRTRYR